MRTFRALLVNTLLNSVAGIFIWFAITFWIFLETRSVVMAGIIGGAYSLSSAFFSPAFGTFVDRHRKLTAMRIATLISFVCFALGATVYSLVDHDALLHLDSPWFWTLMALTLFGSAAGSLRGIVMSTCVTLLVPPDRRDRANGMVGTVTGITLAITSVFSGLVVGGAGMGWAYVLALVLTAVALVHLRTIHIDEPAPAPATAGRGPRIDVRGALAAIHAVPGLGLLILLACFNNLLLGIFRALVDPYGLSMMSVESWGLMWGLVGIVFVVAGVYVARYGLGNDPLRVILLGNLVSWIACSILAIQPSVVLLCIGIVAWVALMPVIEAAEQTVLQRAIPYERQGRVFGFAEMLENTASPLTSFLMAPLAQTVFVPFMTHGAGARLIGGWFGTGPARGLALLFTVAGLIGIIMTVVALLSRTYRRLSGSWQAVPAPA
jgi:MFS transporter, DHA3 family, multidrug efflux protein